MKKNNITLKETFSKSINYLHGNWAKMLVSSTIQFALFLITYFLTHSFIISFVVYGIFIPSQIAYMTNIKDAKVEAVYRIKNKLSQYLILSLLMTIVFAVFGLLLIAPAVIFFANFVFVYEIIAKEDTDIVSAFKKAREHSKGYRGKIALVCLIFMLLFVLLVGFGILFMFLIGLLFPILNISIPFIWTFVNAPGFVYFGMIIGLSAFLVFMFPIEMVVISNLYHSIENMKNIDDSDFEDEENIQEENQEEKNDENNFQTEIEKVIPSMVEEKQEPQEEIKKEIDNDSNDGDEPADYIY